MDAGGALASPGRRAVAGGVLASPGRRANAGGRVVFAWEGRADAGDALASPGGREVLAWEGRAEAGGALASLGGRANAWEGGAVAGDALASPGGRANAWRRSGTCLGRNSSFPRGVFAREGVIPSLGGFAWEGVIPSLGGGLTWELFTWELFRLREAKLFVREAKLLMLVLLDLVIFPSFLIVSKFSLFIVLV